MKLRIGTALRHARQANGKTQQELARSLFISDSLLSSWETGKQKPPREMRRRLARELDSPRVYMEMAHELCGGIMTPVFLDGPNADLHRATTHSFAIEEFRRALDCLEACKPIIIRARSGDQITEAERQQIGHCLQQAVKAKTGAGNWIVVMCESYGFRASEIYEDHHRELAAKGYISRTKEKAPAKGR